jgi:hypothetical protein
VILAMSASSIPRSYELDRGRIRRYKFIIGFGFALALFPLLVWWLAPAEPRSSWAMWVGAAIPAGASVWIWLLLRRARTLKLEVNDDGISVIRNETEKRWVAWESVKSAQTYEDGLKLRGVDGEVLVDIDDDMHGFDELRLFALSRLGAPAEDMAANYPAPHVHRYQRPANLAGSVGFSLLLFLGSCFFLLLAIKIAAPFAWATAFLMLCLGFQLSGFLRGITAIEIATDRVTVEYPWRKAIVRMTDIAALGFDDYVGRHGRQWRIGLVMRDGREIRLTSRDLGVDEAQLYRELCALAPAAAQNAREAAMREV